MVGYGVEAYTQSRLGPRLLVVRAGIREKPHTHTYKRERKRKSKHVIKLIVERAIAIEKSYSKRGVNRQKLATMTFSDEYALSFFNIPER